MIVREFLLYKKKYGKIFFKNKQNHEGVHMYKRSEKIAAILLFIILIISMLPVMYLGYYNHPTGDDYYYGADAHRVWEETRSISATVAEAVKGVVEDYYRWQGTYSAMFLMRLAPNVFSESAYKLVTPVILILLSGGIFYLLKPIICKVLQASKSLWVIVSSTLTLLCVQTVPSQGETFFWYNGSMYYTGYFAVTLFFFGVLSRYLLKPRLYYVPLMGVLAAFLAGGNYVSLLPTLLLAICVTVALIYKRNYKQALVVGSITIILLFCFGISALAPGNALRQSGMWKIPAWKAILKSLLQGVRYMWAWMRGFWWIAALLVTPFFWKSFEKISWSFRYPVLVIGLVYGIFCSMSCPTFYTMNSTGPARAVAIVYYGFGLATFFCYYYLLGYVYRKCQKKDIKILKNEEKCWGRLATYVSVTCLLLMLMQGWNGNIFTCTTAKAVDALASGEAKAYELEYRERIKLLENESLADVVFSPYANTPAMLYVGDISGDPAEPTNQKVAQHFGKNSVVVAWE